MKTIYKKLLFLLLFLPFSILAQGTLDGTVVDSKSNQPIPGVNVVIAGSTSGTQTDFDGKFKLAKLNKGDKIVFSFIGYTSQTVVYNNQQTLNVSLVEESNELKEVVVQVGYGSVKKKDATGSVALVTAKDFNKGPITNTENLINGRVAGVVVTQGGRPGDGAAIRIRGGASLYASNDPLIVIDGLPVDKGLSSVNPNDIESFSILKDASATAIYGSRGSNGVILIKTKKGTKKDEIQFSFNSFTTLNTLVKKVDVYNADEFKTIVGTYVVPDRSHLLGKSNTDWQDEIFKDGVTSDNNFSARGNLFNMMPTRLSVGYTKVDGVLMTSQFDRRTVGVSMTPSFFTDHLKFEINANYAYEKNRYADEGAIGAAIAYDPTQSVYDPTSPFGGYREWYTPAGSVYSVFGATNPVALLKQKNNRDGNQRIYGNVQMEYKFHFLEDLKAVVNVGLDQNKKDGTDITATDARSGLFSGGLLGGYKTYWENSENQLFDGYFNYNKLFGKVKVDFTAGYSYQNFENEKYNSGNTLEPTPKVDLDTKPSVNLQAFYGRLNLDLYDRYLVTLNYRRDGTSRFSEQNRWGNFPGVAVAWKVANESFLKDSKTISDLKLRLGWGVTGQQAIPKEYDYFKRYNLSSPTAGAMYPFGDTYYVLGKPEGYNETLKWEETTTYNIGIDYGFYDNRLTGSLDFYNKVTKDLFADVTEGALQNFRTKGPANIGELNSKGVEFGLNYKAIQTDNSNLGINFNMAYNKQEITSLDGNSYTDIGGVGLDVYTQTYQVGLAPNTFWVYNQVYGADGRPIDGVYVDTNADGAVNSSDKYAYKKPNADLTFGFMTNYNYKKWDFSMAWRASEGNYIFDNVSASRAFLSQGVKDNNVDAVNNSPSDFSNTLFSQKRQESDYYIQNGSWIKWDNVTIGYSFENPLGIKTKTSSLRLYTGIQNVLVITKYKGMDPEIFGGNDSSIYPRARMYMCGLNFNF